jgi:hypothetical protein
VGRSSTAPAAGAGLPRDTVAAHRAVRDESRELMAAMTPLHTQWCAQHDMDGELLRRFKDGNQSPALDGEDFSTADHHCRTNVPYFVDALLHAFGIAS